MWVYQRKQIKIGFESWCTLITVQPFITFPKLHAKILTGDVEVTVKLLPLNLHVYMPSFSFFSFLFYFRIENLELLSKFGTNAWKTYNEVLAKLLVQQQKQLTNLRYSVALIRSKGGKKELQISFQ